ncbi:hypothetical protein LLG46_15860 [bacterium]|nr:hypothetical protein [bacterium]
MKKIACISLLLMCLACQLWAFTLDFEGGTDWDAVGWITSGVQLITIGGDDVIYADIDEGWKFKSDNGKQSTNWEFFISGDMALSSPYDNVVRVNFTDSISHFQIGYSSWYTFVIEAYDLGGNLLDQESGDANSKYWNGTGLSYLDLYSSSGRISYVLLYADEDDFANAGWWVADNMTYEYPSSPAIPEWPSAMLASSGMMMLGYIRRLKLRLKS